MPQYASALLELRAPTGKKARNNSPRFSSPRPNREGKKLLMNFGSSLQIRPISQHVVEPRAIQYFRKFSAESFQRVRLKETNFSQKQAHVKIPRVSLSHFGEQLLRKNTFRKNIMGRGTAKGQVRPPRGAESRESRAQSYWPSRTPKGALLPTLPATCTKRL